MRIEYSKGDRASKELVQLHRKASFESSGRKMKVLLIFPPDWFPSEPYLSLPSLTSVLRKAGHTVIQKDINLEMWDWYFSEDFLESPPQGAAAVRPPSQARQQTGTRRLGDGCAACAVRCDPPADRRADQEGGEGRRPSSAEKSSTISTS